MPDPEPVQLTYRVEHYDHAWGGWRNDDLAPRGLDVLEATEVARRYSDAARYTSYRVVNEQTGEVVKVYRYGRAVSDSGANGRV
jgi:hypothetical protein